MAILHNLAGPFRPLSTILDNWKTISAIEDHFEPFYISGTTTSTIEDHLVPFYLSGKTILAFEDHWDYSAPFVRPFRPFYGGQLLQSPKQRFWGLAQLKRKATKQTFWSNLKVRDYMVQWHNQILTKLGDQIKEEVANSVWSTLVAI